MKKLGMMLACFCLIGFFGCAPEPAPKTDKAPAAGADKPKADKPADKPADTKPADKK
jgi:hypothetical protein